MSYVMALATALTEYSSANFILGSNGMPDRPWAAILYDYFIKNYAGTEPPKYVYNDDTKKNELLFSLINRPLDEKEAYRVFVMRGAIKEDPEYGAALTKSEEEYIFMIYIKERSLGELFPEMENIANEIRRIFIREYISYDIAGIRRIDKFRSTGLIPPDSPANPEAHHWLLPCKITIYYQCNSLFNPTPTESSFNAMKYNAGAWRKEVDGRWSNWEEFQQMIQGDL